MPWHGNPLRNPIGDVVPHDDQQRLPNDSNLVRHVPNLPGFEMLDENFGIKRPTSAAFTFSTTGSKSMSVDAYEQLLANGLPADHFATLAGKRAALVPVGAARENFLIGPEPILGNEYHCGVWQPDPPLTGTKTKSACRKLSRASRML